MTSTTPAPSNTFTTTIERALATSVVYLNGHWTDASRWLSYEENGISYFAIKAIDPGEGELSSSGLVTYIVAHNQLVEVDEKGQAHITSTDGRPMNFTFYALRPITQADTTKAPFDFAEPGAAT